MKYIILWLMTIVLSGGMEIFNILKIFKDAADNGYKIFFNDEDDDDDKVNDEKSEYLSYICNFFIPIVNIFHAMQHTMEYNNSRFAALDQFRVMGELEEMSDYEKREYAKRPTMLNAFLTPLIYQAKLKLAQKIVVEDNGQKGVIHFREEKGDIVILKTEGYVSRLGLDRQKELVIDIIEKTLKVINNSENVELLIKKLAKGEDVVLELNGEENFENQSSQNNQNDNLGLEHTKSLDEKLQELNKLKQQLIEEKESLQHQSQDTDDISYVKKR